PMAAPSPVAPQTPPQKPQQPARDRQRELQMAEAQVGDYSTGLPLDFMNLPKSSPDQFSVLLASRRDSSGAGAESAAGEPGGAQLDSASMTSTSGNAGGLGSAGVPGSVTSGGSIPAFPGGRSIEQLEYQQQQAEQALANTRPSRPAPGNLEPAR